MRVPDLQKGYMINTYEAFNRFQTSVECVLVRERADGKIIKAHLSSRCRPEGISPTAIFSPIVFYTFGICHTDEQNYAVYIGSSQCSRNPFRRASRPNFIPTDQRSVVHCPEVAAVPVSFDEVLADLQKEGPGKDNQYYMRVSWEAAGERFSLFTSCGYINFPHPELDQDGVWVEKPTYFRHEHRYVQPIRGPVVYCDATGYHLAYVAAHLTASGTQRMEFCLRDDLSFFALRPASGWRKVARDWLARSWIGRYFTVSDYHRIVPVSGDCTLYRYS